MKRDWLTVWRFPRFPDDAHDTVVATRTKHEAALAVGLRSSQSHHRVPAYVTHDNDDIDCAMPTPGVAWVRPAGALAPSGAWQTLISFRMDQRMTRTGRKS